MRNSITPTTGTEKRKLKRGYRTRRENFKGGYINHLPEIRSYDLNENSKGIVIATDGLWDELSSKDVEDIYNREYQNSNKLIKTLLDQAILKASERHGITADQLRKIEPGRRRSLHDDITVLYLDLQNLLAKGN